MPTMNHHCKAHIAALDAGYQLITKATPTKMNGMQGRCCNKNGKNGFFAD